MGDEVFRHGLHSYIKATFADELSEGLVEALVERGRTLGSPLAQVEVLSLGGAIARVPSDATAYPHRSARWLLNIPASWEDPAETEREVAWVRETFAAIKPYASGGAYVNFMEADDVDADETAYGETLARLRQVKRAYDPQNVFSLNQNIVPAASHERPRAVRARARPAGVVGDRSPRLGRGRRAAERAAVRGDARRDRGAPRARDCSTWAAGAGLP